MCKLKDCPFCGNKAELRDDSEDISMDGKMPFWVNCTHCQASVSSFYDAESAIEEWNNRVTQK